MTVLAEAVKLSALLLAWWSQAFTGHQWINIHGDDMIRYIVWGSSHPVPLPSYDKAHILLIQAL